MHLKEVWSILRRWICACCFSELLCWHWYGGDESSVVLALSTFELPDHHMLNLWALSESGCFFTGFRSFRPCFCWPPRFLEVFVRAYVVRQAAAVTYGALGATSTGLALSDVENSADLFMGWALPRLKDSTFGTEATGLALAGLREFLAIGKELKSPCDRYVDALLWAVIRKVLRIRRCVSFGVMLRCIY